MIKIYGKLTGIRTEIFYTVSNPVQITFPIWVIETKGGESNGKDKNIDRQIENKFNAFKDYAHENQLNYQRSIKIKQNTPNKREYETFSVK